MSPTRQPETTRAKILEAALELFHVNTFNGTSINLIVERAGITKGALFHHFKGKNELAYAVIDGPLRESIRQVWVEPLSSSVDPIKDLKDIVHSFGPMLEEDPELVTMGCPLNNLSQELSSMEGEFRRYLSSIYREWEEAVEKALRAGILAGNVRADIDPASVATTFVALSEGCIGLLKAHGSVDGYHKVAQGSEFFLNALAPGE